MPKLRLTEAAIRKRKTTKRVELWDTVQAGLLLRVSPDGSRVFYLRYLVPDGRYRRLKLGYYVTASAHGDDFNAEKVEPGHGPLTLREAREVAGVQRGRVASQRDPQAEKQARNHAAALAKGHTVRALVTDYIEHQRSQGRKTVRQESQRFEKDVLTVIGDRPAAEVTARDVERILGRITRRAKRAGTSQGGKVQANRVRTALVSLYNFATLDPDWREVVQTNPAMLTRRPLKKEKRRSRVLDDSEIRALWLAVDKLDPTIGAAFRFRLLCGQRWSETRLARWEHIRHETATIGGESVEVALWWLPGENTKNAREHVVPLSPQAEKLLDGLRETTGDSEWIFPSSRKTGEHLGECGRSFRRWRDAAKVGAIRHTDIRRTLVTGLSRLGFRLEIRQAVVNHTPQDVTRDRYDRYDFLAEKRRALCAWADDVDRAVKGKQETSNVREFKR